MRNKRYSWFSVSRDVFQYRAVEIFALMGHAHVVTSDIVPHGRRAGTSERVNEGTFIILLIRRKDRSPSLKHRDTMPMRPVVSTSLHLSARRQLVPGKKEKNEPPFSKCSVAINLSSSPRAARIVRTRIDGWTETILWVLFSRCKIVLA